MEEEKYVWVLNNSALASLQTAVSFVRPPGLNVQYCGATETEYAIVATMRYRRKADFSSPRSLNDRIADKKGRVRQHLSFYPKQH